MVFEDGKGKGNAEIIRFCGIYISFEEFCSAVYRSHNIKVE
jgi:hypothetical protein